MSIQKVVIFTLGTRGDIQPYIFLAKALNSTGFATIIATHPCWKSLVENAGVAFSPIGPNIDISYEAAAIRENQLIGSLEQLRQ